MLKTKDLIEKWLKKMNIYGYFIHDNLVVDVDNAVTISRMNLDHIPIQFGTINGDFYCVGNRLTTLKGAPFKVNGEFDCSNNLLTSLKYAPKEIAYHFDGTNNLFKTFNYLSLNIGGEFYCSHNKNQKIEELSFYYSGELYDEHSILEIEFFILKQYLLKLKLKDKLEDHLSFNNQNTNKNKL